MVIDLLGKLGKYPFIGLHQKQDIIGREKKAPKSLKKDINLSQGWVPKENVPK
ncbi:17977_t:CDS:2 [Entrophospora sp. SA101]|nr:17977_t:CDS:2 [Entrophospora sp. SA101]